jgi:hypothetical protein
MLGENNRTKEVRGEQDYRRADGGGADADAAAGDDADDVGA